ncbi:hypothetical protein AVEN_41287-1 [Araneus ventricosus]|uniref:Uncharacterized protein n=1 Tax=Araneus ventricosus TaxID=182803 RepID=A0A4Y2M9D5_ARAVE|nr:hypothetical protein AVEN_41287-1 [Araneus ventricosus]
MQRQSGSSLPNSDLRIWNFPNKDKVIKARLNLTETLYSRNHLVFFTRFKETRQVAIRSRILQTAQSEQLAYKFRRIDESLPGLSWNHDSLATVRRVSCSVLSL